MKKILYIIATLALLTACKNEADIVAPGTTGGSELKNIQATIGGLMTRASGNSDYVGRDVFDADNIMVITKMNRTEKALTDYSYTNICFKRILDYWEREILTGFYVKERIYWTDNASPHTFVGYCTPNSWVSRAEGKFTGSFIDKKWTKIGDTDAYYTGQFTKDDNNIVDFSATFNNESPNIDKKGTKLKNEDILLLYETNQKADQTGLTTTVHFRHALASLRVIVDINEFAPSASSMDTRTLISDMEVLNQPWKYKWTQAPQGTIKGVDIPGWGVSDMTTKGDGTVTIKTWQPRPQGEGDAQAKKFTFYSLIVPGKQTDFSIKYKVSYPNATNPQGDYKEETYKASIAEIEFRPGYCTTLKVSLNHDGEPVIIGAEYIDWENVQTPDRSELQKVSTYLDIINRKDASNNLLVSIANDQVNGANITIDDATWLYIGKDENNQDIIKDIYGNDGNTEATAYQIKSARQFLSFMYEVNEAGRTFEDKYIKLETGLYLQPGTTTGEKKNSDGNVIVNELETSKLLQWPGIGTAEKPFNGTFLGGVRLIKRLYGNPLFNNIGSKGHVDQLLLEDVLGITNGGGAFAGVNSGIICAGKVSSINTWTFNVTSTTDKSKTYAGAFVGVNKGVIMTCYATGAINSSATYTGGLVGKNTGAIVVSYAANKVTSTATDPKYGGIVAENSQTKTGEGESAVTTLDGVTYCFFCKDNWNNNASLQDYVPASVKAMTTIEMQKSDFIGDPGSKDTNTLNGAINVWSAAPEKWPSIIKTELTSDQKINELKEHFASRYYTYHVATFPWVY